MTRIEILKIRAEGSGKYTVYTNMYEVKPSDGIISGVSQNSLRCAIGEDTLEYLLKTDDPGYAHLLLAEYQSFKAESV